MITTTLHPGTLSQKAIDSYMRACDPIITMLRNKQADAAMSPYVFLQIPYQEEQRIHTIKTCTKNLSNTRPIDVVMVIGIGGSSLGTQAIYTALRHHLPHDAPQLWCADTIDPVTTYGLLTAMEQALRANKNIVLVIISKSGTTLETCANASLYIDVLRTHVTDIKHHVIIITDPGSPLETHAQQEGISHALVPPPLGGRFSVFSAVGLVPLMLMGIDIHALLHGAQQATHALERSPETMSQQVAVLAAAYDAGFVIHDTFVTAPHLAAYGAWYRQLLAESLGKYHTIHGSQQRVGMTPTVSCIANDLHSMAQLYLAGPRRTITTFVDIACTKIPTVTIPHDKYPVQHIHKALCTGIYTAYREAQLPYLHTTSSTCSTETWGYMMQQQMIIITMLGHLWNINPFDQPQVEDYKKWTRAFLKK